MQKSLHLRAYAKINLTFDVIARREDGYHEVDTLMTRVTLHDTLLFAPSGETSVVYKNIPTPENDIVRRAIEAYANGSGRRARVLVQKRIPMEAGLGGGSADAAAVLNALQSCYGAYTQDKLYDIALKVGADVPFCMQTKACRARGIGEILEPVDECGELWFLIVKPAHGISTKSLFSSITLPSPCKPDTGAAVDALIKGDRQKLGGLLCNGLEPFAVKLSPEVGKLSEALLCSGALGVCMTGSGSAVIGMFEGRKTAYLASKHFSDIAFYTVARNLPH